MAKHKVEQTCFITAQLHHPGEVIDYSGVEMPGVLTPLKQRQTVAPTHTRFLEDVLQMDFDRSIR